MKNDVLKNLMPKVSYFANRVKFGAIRKSPEITMAIGIAGVVGGAVCACISTTKLPEVKKNAIARIEEVKNTVYSDERAARKDLTKAYGKMILDYAKLYAVPAILEVSGVTCILSSHSELKRRNASLASAYAAIDSAFKQYRKKVIEDSGEDKDLEYRYGIIRKDIMESSVDEATGEVKEHSENANVLNENCSNYGPFARFFDERSREWVKDSEMNWMFLYEHQNEFNRKLKNRGYVFLNEVFYALDIPPTKLGSTFGWVYDPRVENKIDFGMCNVRREAVREFVNGYERSILLDFNVDGDILDKVRDDTFSSIVKDESTGCYYEV